MSTTVAFLDRNGERIWFALRAYLLTEVIWSLESKPATQHTTARIVAQLGSAPGLGPGGRGFESRHSDDTSARTLVLRVTTRG